jgi:hypothetical protein
MVALGPATIKAQTAANKPQKEIHIHEIQGEIKGAMPEFKQTEHVALRASVVQPLENRWTDDNHR